MDQIGKVKVMIELFEKDIKQDDRQSSKGNQLKWENNGIWYKTDYTGYEGLSEYVVSQLLKKSSLERIEFAEYYPEEIRYKTQIMNGCKSRDFSEGWQTITLERLFKNQYAMSLNRGIYSLENYEDRLKYLVEQAERITGIKEFGVYMAKLLTIDALFLNEDRHTHNISVLMKNNKYRLCPIYDNGAALMSDTTMDYPLGCDLYNEIKNVKAKTFCDSFEEQLDASEKLYGRPLAFSWGEKDITACLEKAPMYSKEIKDRVKDILLEQRRKYRYLFRS